MKPHTQIDFEDAADSRYDTNNPTLRQIACAAVTSTLLQHAEHLTKNDLLGMYEFAVEVHDDAHSPTTPAQLPTSYERLHRPL